MPEEAAFSADDSHFCGHNLGRESRLLATSAGRSINSSGWSSRWEEPDDMLVNQAKRLLS